MQKKEPARDTRLEQLRAFGLFIAGTHTLYQIAEALGGNFVERNPSTAAGRARTRIAQGWRIICVARVERWRLYWSREFPLSAWQGLHGARLDTHPAADPPAPIKELTPFERLLSSIQAAEAEARAGGFFAAAEGLRNLGAALRYSARGKTEEAARQFKKKG